MRKALAFSLTVLFTIGCSDAATIGPQEDTGPVAPAPEFASKAVIQSVTGSGHFEVAGQLRTFSFTARRHADGSVEGEWQQKNRAVDVKAHGDVTCFAIIGNQVWIGGIAERAEDAPGEVAWRAVDNGQGANAAPDQISQKFFGQPPGFAANYCAATPAVPPLTDVEAGNIQIKG